MDFRLRFPIVNKPSLTIAAGIKYTHEEFRFANAAVNNYALYKDMEDRPLKSLGLHFYVVKPTHAKKYFILRASFDLNGDYTLVIPVFSINKNFNCHWGIESLLPVNIRLRYTPNPKIDQDQNPI